MTQSEALDILKSGQNVFLTGSAGSGKTYVLNQYIAYLKDHEIPVAVTATTGIAATHMGGTTIHSWTGIGIKDFLTDQDLDAMEQKSNLYGKIQKTKVLIIDEISMLHSYRLDMIDTVCRAFKRAELPFGGLQVIFSGDFFQLPPISRNADLQFACDSKIWPKMDLKTCYLEEQHRQNDSEYFSILQNIRQNSVNEDIVDALNSRLNVVCDTEIRPTRLYTHNQDVDAENERELNLLSGESRIFEMTKRGKANISEGLAKNCLASERLVLKIGAMVMFVKNNFEAGYVNGTLGRVVAWSVNNMPIVETYKGERITALPVDWTHEDDGKIIAQISQVPLRLAWAITVHKSQGMSLDAAEIDLSRSFVPGQGYVALSRLRSLQGLYLKGLNATALRVDEHISNLNRGFQDASLKAEEEINSFTNEEKKKMEQVVIQALGGITNPVAQSHINQSAFKQSTIDKTKALLIEKKSLSEIAQIRGLTLGTIVSHLEKINIKNNQTTKDKIDIDYLRPENKKFKLIQEAFTLAGGRDSKLVSVHQFAKNKFTFDELRVGRIFL